MVTTFEMTKELQEQSELTCLQQNVSSRRNYWDLVRGVGGRRDWRLAGVVKWPPAAVRETINACFKCKYRRTSNNGHSN
jgi:hypothetical protein